MPRISQQAKDALVKKALGSKHQSVREIAELNNVGYSSLQKWIRKHQVRNLDPSKKMCLSLQLIRSKQLDHLLATENLDEVSVGAYCRRQGLYSFQLQQWKNEFMTKDTDSHSKKDETASELKTLKQENKRLKREIKKKEMELNEATLMLKFKKKIDLLLKVKKVD